MLAAERDDDTKYLSQFSLFEGDLVNRLFSKIKVGGRHPTDLLLRMVIILGITWVPMALLSFLTPVPASAKDADKFFYDFAAYAQFFVGIPLFIIAERIVSENVLNAARDFYGSGVVRDADKPVLEDAERTVALMRWRLKPELICIGIAYYFSFMAIGVEMFSHDAGMVTWHSDPIKGDGILTNWMTPAGWYALLIALPIQSYWWLRWVWKITIWYWYLNQVSKLQLVLVASHPDHTGGIAFLSEVQSKFAIIILAFAISSIVATVGYKLGVENAPADMPAVWGMVAGFIVVAPTLFLSPLLLFTKQLHRTKERALRQFRERAVAAALRVEEGWLAGPGTDESEARARDDLARINLLTGFYERISDMRVVPFDLRSAAQLIGSAVGPMIPLLPYFVKLPEPWQAILEAMTKWLPH